NDKRHLFVAKHVGDNIPDQTARMWRATWTVQAPLRDAKPPAFDPWAEAHGYHRGVATRQQVIAVPAGGAPSRPSIHITSPRERRRREPAPARHWSPAAAFPRWSFGWS